jgi:fucose 4-O-acetylase-like acetyltransferase
VTTLLTAPADTHPLPAGRRDLALDRLRGLAVACMVVDHVALFTGADGLRVTVGRLAMPLFFLLAGHLATRASWRLLNVLAAGVFVYAIAPWTGAAMLLTQLVAGALLVVVLRRRGTAWLVAALVVLASITANSWDPTPTTAYATAGMWSIMLAGALLPRPALRWGARLPASLGILGRYPLTVYAGHALLLTVVVSA